MFIKTPEYRKAIPQSRLSFILVLTEENHTSKIQVNLMRIVDIGSWPSCNAYRCRIGCNRHMMKRSSFRMVHLVTHKTFLGLRIPHFLRKISPLVTRWCKEAPKCDKIWCIIVNYSQQQHRARTVYKCTEMSPILIITIEMWECMHCSK